MSGYEARYIQAGVNMDTATINVHKHLYLG